MRGMSRIIDFLMDSLFVIEEPLLRNKILSKLDTLSCNLQLFYKNKEKLFYGEQLFKLSTDITAGTAGILLTLERYRVLKTNKMLYPSEMLYLDKELSILKEIDIDEVVNTFK